MTSINAENNIIPPVRHLFYARYNPHGKIDAHDRALKMIKEKKYIVGERARILKHFTNEDERNLILNSQYFIEVENVEQEFKNVLKNYIIQENLNFKSIAVTGTSGKTSTVEFAWQLLEKLLKKPVLKMGTLGVHVANEKIQNSHATTPDYLTFYQALQLAHKKHTDILIMEMSSQALGESRLDDYPFDIGVFTNFSQDHLDFHKSMENYLNAKILLFTKNLKANGVCIISTRSPEWLDIVKNSANSERTLYLLIEENKSIFEQMLPFQNKFKVVYSLSITNRKSTFSGISGCFIFQDDKQNIIFSNEFSTPLIGETNFENLMCAYSVCVAMGYTPQEFISFFPALLNTPGRLQKVIPLFQANQPHVIVDYAHKPGALESVLKTLRSLISEKNKIITVFGCGGNRDTKKRPLMGKVAELYSDIIMLTSDNPRNENPESIIQQIASGISKEAQCVVEINRRHAIKCAIEIAKENDIVLIAGKGDETYQIIGNEKKEFSDVKVAEEILAEMSLKNSFKMNTNVYFLG